MSEAVELREENVPLEEIAEMAQDLIELYGGEVEGRDGNGLAFTLPARRGVAAAGDVACTLRWTDAAGGTIILTADRNVAPPKFQRLLLLIVGVSGAMLWMLWPFFPNMGALAWIGGAVAFATWFITARTTTAGTASDLLQRLARAQREGATDDR